MSKKNGKEPGKRRRTETFAVDRLTPFGRKNKQCLLLLEIKASSAAEASRIADEIQYASGWVLGVYPDGGHNRPPEQWAEVDARAALKGAREVKPLIYV